jgi:FMN phosphatase YigB (HAD superfamily)
VPRRRHLLLDLDGTLLGVDMDIFVPRMVASMREFFAAAIPGDGFGPALREGFTAMAVNDDPRRTVLDVFLDVFGGRTGLGPGRTRELFEAYYRGPFCGLASLSSRLEGVAELLETAFRRGFTVSLATKPIFPRDAIRERMRWAGVEDAPFEVVTAAEIMHWCKPHPGYWRELLAMLGAAPGDCLMAGNDREQDLAAGRAGIPTYFVGGRWATGDDVGYRPDDQGTLTDLAALLDRPHPGRRAPRPDRA